MTALDTTAWVTLLGALVLAMAFVTVRRLPSFAAFALGVVVASAIALWGVPGVQVGTRGAGTAGLTLLAVGLSGVRAMLVRSVSLRLLEAIQVGLRPEDVMPRIRRRTEELQRLHLAVEEEGRLRPTWLGRCLAGVLALLYRLTGESGA